MSATIASTYTYPTTKEEFSDLVASDVRDQLELELKEWLRSPENIDEWRSCLATLIQNLDFQIAGQKVESFNKRLTFLSSNDTVGYDQYLQSTNRWKISTLRFRRACEERMSECKSLKRKRNSSSHATVKLLIEAIENHHSECLSSTSDNFQSIDEKLWNVLTEPAISQYLN